MFRAVKMWSWCPYKNRLVCKKIFHLRKSCRLISLYQFGKIIRNFGFHLVYNIHQTFSQTGHWHDFLGCDYVKCNSHNLIVSLNYIPPFYNFWNVCFQVIYVARNPKDVIVSYYYFHKMANFLNDPGPFSEFLSSFLDGTGLQPFSFFHLTNQLNKLQLNFGLNIILISL